MTNERGRPALRALRREPGLVDDRLAGERLEAEGALTSEAVRWARAWLVCWHAALVADDRYGLDDPWEIPIRVSEVALPKGCGEPTRRDAVLAALAAAGLVRLDPPVTPATSRGGRGVARMAWLRRDLFVDHPAAIGVDWPAVVDACADPAPLLVMRALAEVATPLDAFVSVPRRDLVVRTGYQQKQVRVAVRRLAALGLLDVAGDSGTTARYRLTPLTLGQPWCSAATARVADVARRVEPASPESSAAPAPVTPAAATGTGVQVVMAGVAITLAPGAAFEVGPGMAARAELGPDGQPRLVIRQGN